MANRTQGLRPGLVCRLEARPLLRIAIALLRPHPKKTKGTEGTPLGLLAHGLRPRYPCLVGKESLQKGPLAALEIGALDGRSGKYRGSRLLPGSRWCTSPNPSPCGEWKAQPYGGVLEEEGQENVRVGRGR
jgi:hypothetical protein